MCQIRSTSAYNIYISNRVIQKSYKLYRRNCKTRYFAYDTSFIKGMSLNKRMYVGIFTIFDYMFLTIPYGVTSIAQVRRVPYSISQLISDNPIWQTTQPSTHRSVFDRARKKQIQHMPKIRWWFFLKTFFNFSTACRIFSWTKYPFLLNVAFIPAKKTERRNQPNGSIVFHRFVDKSKFVCLSISQRYTNVIVVHCKKSFFFS